MEPIKVLYFSRPMTRDEMSKYSGDRMSIRIYPAVSVVDGGMLSRQQEKGMQHFSQNMEAL